MKELTVEESLDYYLTTLHLLDERNLKLSDDDLLTIILEDLDLDVHTYLHHWTVERLIENKLIPIETKGITEELRNYLIEIIDHKRSIEQIRFGADWIIARNKANAILIIIDEFKNE